MDNIPRFEASSSNFPAFDAFSRLFDVSLRYASMFGVTALLEQANHARKLARVQEKRIDISICAVHYFRDIVSSEGIEEYTLYAKRLRVFSGSRYAFQEPDSLDRPIENDDTGLSLIDVITANDSPEEKTHKEEIKKIISDLFNFLSTEEQQMLALRFGLCNNELDQEMTMIGIGSRLGISRETVRKRYEILLDKCRHYFKAEGFTVDDFF